MTKGLPIVIINTFLFLLINIPPIFLYGMHGCSSAAVCKALWKFFIDIDGFPCTIQCDFDHWLIGGKSALTVLAFELLLLVDKIIMVWFKINEKN